MKVSFLKVDVSAIEEDKIQNSVEIMKMSVGLCHVEGVETVN